MGSTKKEKGKLHQILSTKLSDMQWDFLHVFIYSLLSLSLQIHSWVIKCLCWVWVNKCVYACVPVKNICVCVYSLCVHVWGCTQACVCADHTPWLMCDVRVHFIRNQCDLRQSLAVLHRYCRRQQPGQLAEKDGMGGVKRADGEQERWKVRCRKERIDCWHDGEVSRDMDGWRNERTEGEI